MPKRNSNASKYPGECVAKPTCFEHEATKMRESNPWVKCLPIPVDILEPITLQLLYCTLA
jgi:hypothetical protein